MAVAASPSISRSRGTAEVSHAFGHEMTVSVPLQHCAYSSGAMVGLTVGVRVVLAICEPVVGGEANPAGIGRRAIRHEHALDRRLVL